MLPVLCQKTRYALKALLELAALPAGARMPPAANKVRRRSSVKASPIREDAAEGKGAAEEKSGGAI